MNFHLWSDLYWHNREHSFAWKLNGIVNEFLVEIVHFLHCIRHDEELESMSWIFLAIFERIVALSCSFQLHHSRIYLIDVDMLNTDQNIWMEILSNGLSPMWSSISWLARQIASLKINNIEWISNENQSEMITSPLKPRYLFQKILDQRVVK